MNAPLRVHCGGAGLDVSSSAGVPASAPGLESALPATGAGAGGWSSSAPMSRRSAPSPVPSAIRT